MRFKRNKHELLVKYLYYKLSQGLILWENPSMSLHNLYSETNQVEVDAIK